MFRIGQSVKRMKKELDLLGLYEATCVHFHYNPGVCATSFMVPCQAA